jgi:hypothetical protein
MDGGSCDLRALDGEPAPGEAEEMDIGLLR